MCDYVCVYVVAIWKKFSYVLRWTYNIQIVFYRGV